MRNFRDLLIELDACNPAVEWAGEKTIEEVVFECHRGDWLLWLAQEIDIGLRPLTLAKAHCANTVRHLMTDERSKRAVDVAIAYGEGKASEEELKVAADAAADAAYAAADAGYAADGVQKKTAAICRKYIGQLLINTINEKLKQ